MAYLSVWEKESFYAAQDVIIIGGGLMGLWSALELKHKQPSLRIAIVERNTIPMGASTRNAGFACFGSPTEMIADAEAMGANKMLEVVTMRYQGIEKIKKHFTDQQLGLDKCGGFECINKDYKYWNLLNEKIAWLNNLLADLTGVPNTFERNDKAIAEKGLQAFDAMIGNTAEASLHSGLFVSALIQKVHAAGIVILNGLEIINWKENPDGMQLNTKQGIQLTGKKLLFCTNAFTETLLQELNIIPARGQVIVTSPIANLPMKGTFHFDEGFYYWRNLGNRILLGGARNAAFSEERTLDMGGSELIKNKLINFLQTHINPSLQFSIQNHWGGIMGFTENKQPLLTKVCNHVFAAIACNGMGVALTPIMGEKAADLLLADF